MRARFWVAGLVFAASLVVAGCGSSSSPSADTSSGSDSGPITIGAAIANTGFMQAYDSPGWAAFKIATEEKNAEGGIDGRKIKLTAQDTTSTPPGAGKAAKNLIANGAEALVVTANFDMGSPAGIAAQEDNVLNISLAAASPKYGVQGIGPQAYTAGVATYLEGATAAQFAKDEGWTNVYALEDTSLDYSTEVCAGFKEKAKELGLNLTEGTFQNTDKSIASQITQMKGSGAQAIMICTYNPGGATAIRQIRAAGIETPLISDTGQGGTYWLEAVPNLSELYVTETVSIYGDDPSPEVNEFAKTYAKVTGEPPSTSVVMQGYAAAQLMFKAIEDAKGSTNGPELTEAMDSFEEQPTVNGPYTFTATEHIGGVRGLDIIKYTNGKPSYYKTVKPEGNVNYHL